MGLKDDIFSEFCFISILVFFFGYILLFGFIIFYRLESMYRLRNFFWGGGGF